MAEFCSRYNQPLARFSAKIWIERNYDYIGSVMIEISPTTPVLIAGPTASGKSALALHIARSQGGIIINADALQVYSGWRLLTARPDDLELAQANHALYGHISYDEPYSTGHWLRDIALLLKGNRPIIVGGTGLNFLALIRGLADIPPTPSVVRIEANKIPLPLLLKDLDGQTIARIDTKNRMRVQRAWEVVQTTGRSITDWQDDTPPPLLRPQDVISITLDVPVNWLNDRITRRFDQMLALGALEEAHTMLQSWDPSHQSSKAIGAKELIAYLQGHITLIAAREAAIISSRQYAKRQRTWFRSKHKAWAKLDLSSLNLNTAINFID